MFDKLSIFCGVVGLLPAASCLLKLSQQQTADDAHGRLPAYACLLALSPLIGTVLFVLIGAANKGADHLILTPFALMFAAYLFLPATLPASIASTVAFRLLPARPRYKAIAAASVAAVVMTTLIVYRLPHPRREAGQTTPAASPAPLPN